STDEAYIGTNVGLFKVKFKPQNKFELEGVKDQNFRMYSLAYNSQNDVLYSSSANGLFAMDKFGNSSKVKYKGKDIFSEKVIYNTGNIYALSREFGILTINDNHKISVIKPQLSAKDETLKSIFIYKNTILLSTSNGLYQINKEGKIINQFHSSYGFSSKKIYSFSVVNNDLWVSHTGGVQKIDLRYKNFDIQKLQIKLKDVKVNNMVVNLNTTHHFNSSDRKFEFLIYSPTLRNSETIKFHYKLIGYEDRWQTQGSKNNSITYNALSPGKYTLVLKAENLGDFSPEKKYTFTIDSPLYAKPWFIISSMILFFLLVFLIYRRQLNIQKQKSKQINELNLSKLTAIQSQMNPHFIFNSLNSIQDLVLQQNASKAYDSIGKFALLIRKIMYHSEKEFIDIEEELSILNVYLEMELLRLKKDFIYEINSHDIADIEIPPMLIQPYIENAIKHGLLHKTGEKKLVIEMKLEDDVFVCEITDNGIGRKKSAEIKERQNKMYESFSGNSLNKRLDILKKHFGGNFGVEIIDLVDHDNNATGTKVILKAPYKQKY
ncbi:MAG: histidine kinase, partial [Bacteroidia bacterium]